MYENMYLITGRLLLRSAAGALGYYIQLFLKEGVM
jgi:hypothetical protein